MRTCLLVDDSRVIRKVSRQIFESIGFVCEEAENGQLALAACQSNLPDFILLDWNMPVMNGIEFIKTLRQMPGGKTPIIVFCSVENDMSHIRAGIEAGANEYIMKPFDADIIRGKLCLLDLLEA